MPEPTRKNWLLPSSPEELEQFVRRNTSGKGVVSAILGSTNEHCYPLKTNDWAGGIAGAFPHIPPEA